ncbi:MAG: helix-turn-helix transcriptional regulator [Marinicaulis sp.]|nr:helix-turn-helix transcriptional regulator [Marinicaulis sp.]NNL87997.1 helix-turn-helix transcriptional regulator [Marinicaulis sp.]
MPYDDQPAAASDVENINPPLDECGMAKAARLLEDRWTMLIIREALYGVTRFDAMQSDLHIPRTVLADRLKRLCANGILTKRDYREPGQRTRSQYVLTSPGVELAVPMIALMQWGDKNLGQNQPAVEIVDRHDEKPCRVGFINFNGEPVNVGDIQLKKSG